MVGLPEGCPVTPAPGGPMAVLLLRLAAAAVVSAISTAGGDALLSCPGGSRLNPAAVGGASTALGIGICAATSEGSCGGSSGSSGGCSGSCGGSSGGCGGSSGGCGGCGPPPRSPL